MSEKTSEEKATALRERIEAALRARDAAVAVFSYDAQVTMLASGATEIDALRSVASAVGLDSDGNDRRSAALNAVRSALGHRAEKYGRDADIASMVRELVAERDAAIAEATALRDTLYRAVGQACPACGYVAVCK
jgi:hypothetical protein